MGSPTTWRRDSATRIVAEETTDLCSVNRHRVRPPESGFRGRASGVCGSIGPAEASRALAARRGQEPPASRNSVQASQRPSVRGRSMEPFSLSPRRTTSSSPRSHLTPRT